MTIDIKISNVRGLSSASLSIDRLALVAGPNHSGKSSLAMAVGCALCRTPAPVDGMTKAAARAMLRENESRGYAAVSHDGKSSRVNWPGGSVSADDGSPWASRIAAGLMDPLSLPAKSVGPWLMSLIDAHPGHDETLEALKDAGLSEKSATAVWDKIQAEGWDNTLESVKSAATREKGAWEQVTGEKWGAQKARNWTPQALDVEYAPSVEDAESQLAEAKSRRDNLKSSAAVSQADIDRLRGELDVTVGESQQLDAARESLKAAQERADAAYNDSVAADKNKAEAVARHRELPEAGDAPDIKPCPDCGAALVISGSQIVHAPEPDDERRQEAQAAAKRDAASRVQTATESADSARSALKDAQARVNSARSAVEYAEKAAEGAENLRSRLQEAEGAAQDGASEYQISSADQAIDHAEQLLAAHRAKSEADHKQASIERRLRVAETLAPDGLRADALSRSLSGFNDRLAQICERAGWARLAVEDDLSFSYGGRPYGFMLSASEKFRARVVLQCAVAEMDGSSVVVIDAADILDQQGRRGLLRSLSGFYAMRFLVTLTMNDRGDVPVVRPPLSSHWISDGNIEDIPPAS